MINFRIHRFHPGHHGIWLEVVPRADVPVKRGRVLPPHLHELARHPARKSQVGVGIEFKVGGPDGFDRRVAGLGQEFGGGAGVGDKFSVTSFQRRAITDGSELTANPDYTFVVRHFAAVQYDPPS